MFFRNFAALNEKTIIMMNTTKILALRKPLLISAWLLAMQGATYAQNPIVQTQLTTDPAPLVVGDRLYVYTRHSFIQKKSALSSS